MVTCLDEDAGQVTRGCNMDDKPITSKACLKGECPHIEGEWLSTKTKTSNLVHIHSLFLPKIQFGNMTPSTSWCYVPDQKKARLEV